MKRVLFCLGLCFVMAPLTVSAQNNAAVTATPIQVGQGWFTVSMDGANTQRWYAYTVVQGRSYCVEGITEKAPTAHLYDGETSVFRADGTTLIGRGDDNIQEPGGGVSGGLSNPGRVCYVAPVSELNFARVGNLDLDGSVKSYQWRVVETTQFCPWFFSGNGFEAFILIRNTTASSVRVTVTLRSTTGVMLGSRSANVPANGSFNSQVSDPLGFNLPTASGSVEIAYGTDIALGSDNSVMGRGGPGAIVANVTSLSFGQGVSFDTPAGPRADFLR